jgi:hypothetical protein
MLPTKWSKWAEFAVQPHGNHLVQGDRQISVARVCLRQRGDLPTSFGWQATKHAHAARSVFCETDQPLQQC